MSVEAMKRALELARKGVEIHNENSPEYKVCAALLAIAEAQKQEPAVYIPADALRQITPPLLILRGVSLYGYLGDGLTPLYTHPQPKRELLTDMEVRELWANHAAKTHGWPKAGASPMHDIGNGLRFETPWHETEYQIFKAGYEAAHRIKGEA